MAGIAAPFANAVDVTVRCLSHLVSGRVIASGTLAPLAAWASIALAGGAGGGAGGARPPGAPLAAWASIALAGGAGGSAGALPAPAPLASLASLPEPT